MIPVLVLPYAIIILAALTGLNVLAVLGLGVASAAVVGLVGGALDWASLLASLQKGMSWMQNLALIAIVIGGLVGLMKAYGGIAWLLDMCLRDSVGGARQAEFRIAALVGMLDVAVANNTVAIVTAGPVARDLAETHGVDPRRTAGLLDVFACGAQGLIPYSGQLLAAGALAGVSPLAIMPWCWYPLLLLVSGLGAIALAVPRLKRATGAEFS